MLCSCGAWASLLHGTWDLPGSGIEPVSPALAGGFFTTEPPGKPLSHLLVAPGTPSQAHSLPPSDLVIQLSPAACLLPTGPLCSILVGRFGCRVTMMLGGVLASLGMVAGSFCRTLGQLYLTAGFITGDCHFILRVTG